MSGRLQNWSVVSLDLRNNMSLDKRANDIFMVSRQNELLKSVGIALLQGRDFMYQLNVQRNFRY